MAVSRGVDGTPVSRPRLALISMPWNAITLPATALSILKPAAARAGWDADVLYLNIRFGERIGFELYEYIANRSGLYPEWFFSAELFGRAGLLANTWDDLPNSDEGRRMQAEVVAHCRGDAASARFVAEAVAPFVQEVTTGIDWTAYRAVGFTVTHAQTCSAALLAQRIKQQVPGIVTIFGGCGVDGEMGDEFLRAFPWADFVVQGEAEDSFRTLLACLDRDAADVPAIAGVRSNAVERPAVMAPLIERMDEVPTPDHDDFFRQVRETALERTLSVSFSIECSRGCWWGEKHHCTFCGLNGTAMRYRSKSPQRVFDEIVGMSRRYRCLNVLAVDKILDMTYCRELFPLLVQEALDLSVFFEVKSNLTDEQVQLMAAAGVERIQPGIESFNSDVLRLMRKGVSGIQNVQFLKACIEAEVEPFWNILYGFPGEQPAHYADLDRLMRLIFHLAPPVDVCPIVFERFSPYVTTPEAFGLTLKPLEPYALLFPPSIDMRRLGSYFEPVGGLGDTSYMAPAIAACREWKLAWQDRPPILHYEEGPGFTVIHDSRPWQGGRRDKPARIVLHDVPAALYAFCQTHRSRPAIEREMLTRFGATPRQVETMLTSLVEHGLMFQEAERFLALAVRKHPQRRAAAQAASSRARRPQTAPAGAEQVVV